MMTQKQAKLFDHVQLSPAPRQRAITTLETRVDAVWKKTSINDALEPLQSSRLVRRTKWDPDSPRFKQACSNLQIGASEIEVKTKKQIEEEIKQEQKKQTGPDMTKELSTIRYNYHLQSVKEFLNDIIAER